MIRTERLVLRPLCGADLAAMHRIFSDPRAMQYWDRPAWNDRDQTARLLAEFMRDAPQDHLEFAVDLDGALIGRVGMWRRYEIGYILHPDHWRQGFATEAVAALLAEIPKRFPEAQVLTAEIDPRNDASARLLNRLGFAQVGYAEKNFDYGGIEMTDTAYYVLRLADAASE